MPSKGALTMREAERQWSLVVNDGNNFHFGFDVVVLGASGVGKSELRNALTGARTDNVMRMGITTTQAAGPVYLKGVVTELEENSLLDIETCTASVALFVYNDDESLQFATECSDQLPHIPLKYFVYNTEEGSLGGAKMISSSCKSFVVNALLSTGVPAVRRAVSEDMWDRLPYPPEASLVQKNVTLGKLFTESPSFMHELQKRIAVPPKKAPNTFV